MSLFSRLREKSRGRSPRSPSRAVSPALDVIDEKYGLFVLTKEEGDYTVDIVAVHGLGGHWKKTWTDDNKAFWLQDFLPQQLPQARIMSYGYNSATAFSKAATDVNDEAAMLLDRLDGEREDQDQLNRPIIFISHSLGGIVVKKALILANERSKQYANILTSTRGLVFFGVPHRGSDIASVGEFAAKLLEVAQIRFGTNTGFVEALKNNSDTLALISQQFIERAADIPIRTFYETDKLGSQLVVDKDSACLNLSNEIAVAVAGANHRCICKFSHANRQKYLQVWKAIKKLVDSALTDPNALSPTVPSRMPSSQTPCFSVSFERDRKFVGREDIIAKIGEKFEVNRHVALAGIGGVGKSQIAIEYCYRFRDEHPESHVFWIHASSVSRISQAYKDIARELGLPGWDDPKVDMFRLVSQSLSRDAYGSWLVLLDNADDGDTFFSMKASSSVVDSEEAPPLVDYLPRSLKGYIIITTRDKRVGESLTGGEEAIIVNPMAELEAEQLLQSKVARARRPDQTKLRELLEVLDYLPLAITQAAAYIVENSITVEDYLEILLEEDSGLQDLLDQDLPDLRRDSRGQNSVIRTWKVSFNQIKDKKPRAAEILSLMAVLDRQGIPKFLLRRGSEAAELTTALGTLQAFSLIRAEVGGKSFEVHRLVQMATQQWLKHEGSLAIWQEKSLKALSAVLPSGNYGTWDTCELLSPHVEAVVRYTFESDSNQLQCAKLLGNISTYYQNQRQYSLAYERCWSALSIQRSLLGSEDQDTLSNMHNLAVILDYQGKYKTAEEIYQQTLELRKKVLGPEHPATLTSMNNIAEVLYKQGKYKMGEEIHHQTLELYKKVLGPEHPATLTSMNNIAGVLYKQGKYKMAEEIHHQTLELYKKVLGPEHPDTLTSMDNVAGVLYKQGKCKMAEEIHHQTLELRKKVLGPEHPATLTSMNNIAGELYKQGKYKMAEEIHHQTLELRKKVLGPEHPDTLTSMNNLAIVLWDQGKYNIAKEMLEQTVDLCKKVLSSEYPDTDQHGKPCDHAPPSRQA